LLRLLRPTPDWISMARLWSEGLLFDE